MMFAQISQEDRLFVTTMCELLSVSRASYYRWKDREETNPDMELTDLIQRIVLHHNGYGYRRVTKELARSYDLVVNHNDLFFMILDKYDIVSESC